MILPDSLYFFSKKLVEVERTPSMVESFAETNEATSWSESPSTVSSKSKLPETR